MIQKKGRGEIANHLLKMARRLVPGEAKRREKDGLESKDSWVGWSIETVEEKGFAAAGERLKDAISVMPERVPDGLFSTDKIIEQYKLGPFGSGT